MNPTEIADKKEAGLPMTAFPSLRTSGGGKDKSEKLIGCGAQARSQL
jgi:hypothetical protein